MLVLHRAHSANISSLFHTCRKQVFVISVCTPIIFLYGFHLFIYLFVFFFCLCFILPMSQACKCYDLKRVTEINFFGMVIGHLEAVKR